MLILFFRKIVRFLRSGKIHVGSDPRRVPAPALILFPLLSDTLCCGLAGILTLHGRGKPVRTDGDLDTRFARASGHNLAALLSGAISPERYLGGILSLEALERGLLRLKGEDAFRRLFFVAYR